MYYGWTILAVCTITAIASAPGQTFVLGMVNMQLREATGLGTTALSGAYLVATLSSAAAMTWVGRLSDRVGPRWVIFLAALGLGAACVALGVVNSLLTLTLVFFSLRFFGQGSLTLGSSHLVALWFDRRLGTAEGIRGAALALGFAVVAPVVAALIARLGWANAYVALGFGVWIAVLPLAAFVARDTPEHMGQILDGAAPTEEPQHDPAYTLGETVRSVALWPVLGLLIAMVLMITAIVFHLQPLLAAAHVPIEIVGLALTVNQLGVGSSTLLGGWLADRIDLRRILLTGGLVSAAGITLLAQISSSGTALVAMGLLGAGLGLISSAGATAIARWFGRRHHGAIRGFSSTAMIAGTSAGPLLLSVCRDLLDSWRPALFAFAGVLVVLSVACAVVRQPAR